MNKKTQLNKAIQNVKKKTTMKKAVGGRLKASPAMAPRKPRGPGRKPRGAGRKPTNISALNAQGFYKGTNIKPTKAQLARLISQNQKGTPR